MIFRRRARGPETLLDKGCLSTKEDIAESTSMIDFLMVSYLLINLAYIHRAWRLSVCR